MATQRDRAGLLVLLEENLSFLKASAAAFDGGFSAEAKRLAVSMRVLLHDTNQSHSLLDQLGVKSQMKFIDTAEHINPRNLLASAAGLVMMQVTTGVGASYIPLVDTIPLPPGRIHPPADFDPWWTQNIARNSDGTLWSRSKFVLTMANKEGGAHVDRNLNAAYESLANHNGLGWSSNTSGVELPFDGNVVAASVRQITYELVNTLEAHANLFT
jgi:hypothetical protein